MTETPDYSAYQTAGDNEFARLSGLVDDLDNAEAKVARLEAELKDAKEDVRRLSEDALPELMGELRQSSVTTDRGITVTLDERIQAGISKERNPEAIKWLDDNGHAGMVKRQFVIRFNRDEEAWANKFQRDLNQRKKQVDCERANTVHASTLKAWAKRQLEAGNDIPLDLFGIFRQKFAKISKPKS